MNIPQELLYQQYVRRELETYRAPYDPEPEFYSYVRQGNTEKIKELYQKYKEIINYLIFGVLTTVVSLVTYYICVFTVVDPDNAIQ